MRHLFQASELKQLELAEVLLSQPDYMAEADLCQLFQLSPITLKTYINQLCKDIPYIHASQLDNEIKLELDLAYGINHVFSHFLENNLSFAILHQLFMKGTSCFQELSHKLYTSDSSLYRAVRGINSALQQEGFDFSMTLTPTELVGNEEDIRAFFSNFFFELYNSQPLPMSEEDRDFFKIIMEIVSERDSLIETYPSYQNFELMFAVNFLRTKGGCRIQESRIREPERKDWDQPDLMKHWGRLLGKPIEEIEDEEIEDCFADILYPFFHKPIAQNLEEFLDSSVEKLDYQRSFHWLGYRSINLERRCGIEIKSVNRLFFKLHSMAHLGRLLPGSYPMIHQPVLNKLAFLREWSPDLWQDSSKMMDAYLKEVIGRWDPAIRDSMQLIFLSHIKNYLPSLIHKVGKVKVLIISNIDQYHAQTMRDISNSSFSKALEFHTYQGYNLNIEDLAKSDYQIIIADFPIPEIPGKKVLRMNNIPTNFDLRKLLKLIEEARKQQALSKNHLI